MASTGEVGCIGSDTSCAVLKAMLSVGYRIPKKNILLSTGTPKQKVEMLSAARLLQQKGYKLFATGGTSKFLTENGVENTQVYWPSETNQQPQALDMLHKKEIDKICGKMKEQGNTVVPLQVYFKGSLVKVEIGLAKGKKLYDKRDDIAKKDQKREAQREFKIRNL